MQEARSALHLAAESGNADICEMLLAKNAYVNSKTKAGWTPLHYVAYNGFNELIHPLVAKHNAAIDATSMVSIKLNCNWLAKEENTKLCKYDANSQTDKM